MRTLTQPIPSERSATFSMPVPPNAPFLSVACADDHAVVGAELALIGAPSDALGPCELAEELVDVRHGARARHAVGLAAPPATASPRSGV